MSDKKLSEYNTKVTGQWNEEATKINSQLFFALSANDDREVFLFFNKAHGQENMIKYLEQVVLMLKNKKI